MLNNKRKNISIVNYIICAFKEDREKKGLTRYRLSKDTGLSESSIAKIEELKQNPTLTTLIEMSIATGFDLPAVLQKYYPLVSDAKTSTINILGNPPSFDKIVSKLRGVEEEKLQNIYKMIEIMLAKE